MDIRVLEEAAPGTIVDRRYAIRREIACGGVARVFEAEHLVTNAKVALKTLRRPALEQEGARARLMREARILGMLRHPNVVAVHDAGSCEKHGPFIALEMIDGRPLDGLLVTRQTLPVGQAVATVIQLCEALHAVHSRGIVHRDIKPANVLISHTPVGDFVALIDFGIASIGKEDDIVDTKLTKMGELLGTFEYMSPEQLMATSPVDARTDIYAAGVMLYECLAGDVPLSGSPTAIITSMIQRARPPDLRTRRPDVSVELEAVVRKALEIDVGHRYQSARELAEACIGALVREVPLLDLLDDGRPTEHPTVVSIAPKSPEEPQRRQFARAPYITPARLILSDGTIRDGHTEDISEGGALFVTDHEGDGDTHMTVRLPLPTSGRVVTIEATSRWIRAGRNQRAFGLEFLNPTQDVRADIRAYTTLMTTGALGRAL